MSNQLTKEKPLTEEHPDGDDYDDDTQSDTDSGTDSNDSSESDSDFECTVCNKRFSGALPLRQHEKGSKHKKVLSRKKKEQKLLDKEDDVEEDSFVTTPYQVCKACDKEFSGPEPYHMHLKSKTHKQKVLHASVLEKVKENGKINVEKLKEIYKSKKTSRERSSEGPENTEASASLSVTDELDHDEHDKEEYECKDCDKKFCGLIPFTQHLVSKTHAKHLERKTLLDKVTNIKISNKSEVSDVSTLSVEDDILVCKVCTTSFSGPENAMSHLKSQKHSKMLDKYLRKLEKKKKKATKSKEPVSESTVNEDKEIMTNKDDTESPEERDEIDVNILVKPKDYSSSATDETKNVEALEENEILMRENYEQYKEAIESLQQEDKNSK